MKVLILSREYPPHVYGGAGVHVEHLSRELAKLAEVEVRCFGAQFTPGAAGTPSARGFAAPAGCDALAERADPRLWKAIEPLLTDLAIASEPVDADVVHCHTWYSMMAGLWIKTLYDIPLVVTTHSLEPLRPWKEEQLGRGYHLSSWAERTAIESADAIVAVSRGTREDVLSCYELSEDRIDVIHNGIDLDVYRRRHEPDTLRRYGIDPAKPYVLFVGRITRQKGILHLLRAIKLLDRELQIVLCAGAPDTKEIGEDTARMVEELRRDREHVLWIPEMVPVHDIVPIYSAAQVFVCPSVYEPFGIINLEAMACETPVVASRVGGIPEVVVDGETGFLVPFDQKPAPDFDPVDPDRFATDFAEAIHRVTRDPELAKRQGRAGRERVEASFGWGAIATQTLDLYERVVRERANGKRATVTS